VEQIESQSDCSGSLFPLVNQLATLPARDLFGDTDGFPDELPDASASFPLWAEVRIFSMALPSTYRYRIKRKILPLHDLILFFYRCVILEAEVKIYTTNNGTLLKVDNSNHDFLNAYKSDEETVYFLIYLLYYLLFYSSIIHLFLLKNS